MSENIIIQLIQINFIAALLTFGILLALYIFAFIVIYPFVAISSKL